MNSMVEILAAYAESRPDVLLVADGKGEEYTYRRAWQAVRRMAGYLKREARIHKGDRVMAGCSQDALFFLADLACAMVGAVFVPVEGTASSDRKRTIYDETGARLWITTDEELPYVKSVHYERMLSYEGESLDGGFPERGQLAEILYTTGTTGRSKGIMITHGANVAVAENIKYGVQMKLGNTEWVPVPISHSHGLRCCYANLLNGGTIVISDGLLSIKKVFEMLDTYRVTAMDVSPSAAQLLIRVSKGRFWEYGKKMDYIQLGTAALPEQLKDILVDNIPGVRLYNFYGSTESGRSCVLEFGKERGKKNCIGKPTKNAMIAFTDEDGTAIAASERNPGLLAAKGAMNMVGYWDNPELSEEVMRDGFVFTRDLGYMDENGYVYILGRKDDVINYNGIKIAPEEIEEIAVGYDGIRDAACVPANDAVAGQVPILYVDVKAENFVMKNYISYLSEHLDGSRMPKRVEIIAAIPRTENGKIKRKELMMQARVSVE